MIWEGQDSHLSPLTLIVSLLLADTPDDAGHNGDNHFRNSFCQCCRWFACTSQWLDSSVSALFKPRCKKTPLWVTRSDTNWAIVYMAKGRTIWISGGGGPGLFLVRPFFFFFCRKTRIFFFRHVERQDFFFRTNLQHSHSRTAVRNSRREVDMNVHVVLYLRACTYRYRCLISKICVLLTQIFPDMCIAVCLPGQLANRYSFCVSDDLFYMLFLQ